jgi:ribosomal protein S18 acetylase RimI-like enzyme
MNITYIVNDKSLNTEKFLNLVQEVWPGEYNEKYTSEALSRTINTTAWDGNRLVGCIRILSDGYFFGTVPEILISPDYQKHGIGRKLMELSWKDSPTSLFFGAQPGNESFFEKVGFEKGMQSYMKKKSRRK